MLRDRNGVMMGRTKDAGELYAYEVPLIAAGFECVRMFLYWNLPEDFDASLGIDGWAWRRAVRKWIIAHPAEWIGKEYRVIRGTGYHRDLHGDAVYEIWAKTVVEMPEGLAGWMLKVLEAEGLGNHTICVWRCKGEGEYDQYDHEIRIGLYYSPDGKYDEVATKKLFLHEVGHGVVDLAGVSFDDSYWHREAWQAEYARLTERHLA